MAGLLVGAGGPAGVTGVAPAATVLPLRVAGWQPDARGDYAVYSRTDQLLAGLERAVDPDGNGDAHDAARIALVPLVEPFAAFTDGPLARAVDGALRLDTLVVAAAGNDGPAGPAFGSVGGPAGAPSALAVGAADAGRNLTQVRVVVRAGLRVLFDRLVPLVGGTPPSPDTRSLSVRSGPGSLLPARALTGGRPRRGRSRRRGSGHDRPSCCGCRRGRRDPARPAGRARRHRSRPPHRYPGGRAPARGHACVAYRARSNGRDRRPAIERRSPDDRGALLVVGACVRRRDQAGPARAGRRTGDRRTGCRSGRRLRLRDGQRLERRRRGGRGRGCAPGRGQARCERGEDSSAARRRGQAARSGSCGRPGGGHARRRPLGRAGARRRPVPPHLRPRDGRGLARGRGAPAPQRLGPQAHGLRRPRSADGRCTPPVRSSPAAPRSSRARSPGSPSTFRRSRSPAARRRSGR